MRERTQRMGFLALGLFMVLLGIIGVVVPLMPTTIFLIAAAWCFARSSPRLEAWLLDHPRFGGTLRAWREQGAISRRGKLLACLGMSCGFVLFCLAAQPALWFAVMVGALMVLCAAYVTSRPDVTGPPDRAGV